MIVTTVLSAAGHVSGTWGLLPKAGAALAALAINTLVLMLVFRFGTAHRLSFSQIVPGALTAAVVWQVLQWFGAAYVARVVASSTATNSIFALVLGLLAFLYLVAMTLVLCAQINAVRANRLYPRSLLTPFTDDVQLTIADRKTYTGQAKAQQAKGFEDIAVTFDPPRGWVIRGCQTVHY